MIGRCRHEWEKVTEKTLPSTIEQVSALNCDADKKDLLEKILREKFFDWHNSKYLIILKCKKCGKLDKTCLTNSNHNW